MASFKDAVETVLKHEGDFVDDKNDKGGATKYGVSLRYLKSLGDFKYDLDGDGDIDSADVRNLSVEDAIEIYRKHWWDKYGYSRFHDQSVATKVFDLSVNAGQKQAVKLLQRACNRVFPKILQVDGIMGVLTIEAANSCDPKRLLSYLRKEAADFYSNLVKQNSLFGVYEAGWIRRALS